MVSFSFGLFVCLPFSFCQLCLLVFLYFYFCVFMLLSFCMFAFLSFFPFVQLSLLSRYHHTTAITIITIKSIIIITIIDHDHPQRHHQDSAIYRYHSIVGSVLNLRREAFPNAERVTHRWPLQNQDGMGQPISIIT